ncbi:MAG: dihydroorotate dehydrogenase electron transfer subunit [Dehalococcoidia bacterium]
MNITQATVLSVEEAYDGAYVIWLHAPELARETEPGQFLMVHCAPEGGDPMFARAFSYHRVDGERVAVLVAGVGRGTSWLINRSRGDRIRAYGPLGNGFRLPEVPGNLLLIGGGVGIAPMVDMAERALAAGHQVVAMMGARTRSGLLAGSAWPKEVEYVVVTEDGSAGPKGYVTQHLGQYQAWASRIYACGPNAMFQSLADVLRFNGRRQRPEILMEENMPCGWGMCYGCGVFTHHGVKLCCKDGPRFNLFDVY